MLFNRKNYTNDTLLDLYKALLLPRLVEEKMLLLMRQGKISKWFSGVGQEAISVGVAKALENDEWILPMHRNLGVFTTRNLSLHHLLAQWQGKSTGFTKGRDRSFHFGSHSHNICGMISHMAANLAVADGIALGNLLAHNAKATLVFCGDGATSEGDFHEAVNVAAVWNLPVIFLIENNGYALSTPNTAQFNCNNLVDKAPGYGIDALQIDGNNVLEVYDTIMQLAKNVRSNPRPVLIEAITFRMRGHEEASGTRYIPEELTEKWAAKDPINNFESYLLQENILTNKLIISFKEKFELDIEQAIDLANNDLYPIANTEMELQDVYMECNDKEIAANTSNCSEKRYLDAIAVALCQSMEKYPNLVIMGQDIGEYGGVYKVTDGLLEKFGKERVRNTPLCESAIVGVALGLSIQKFKTVVEMQYADFVTCTFNQIVNNLAKSHYRWGQNADVVIRMPTGAGNNGGPFHSQSTEAWFFRVPGLKIVFPSNPDDAKGLLCAAINDPNPVLFFEHKYLYRSIKAEINDDYYTTPIGKARISNEGNQLTIITYGMGVWWATEVTKELQISAQIVDLRTLMPWDKIAVKDAVLLTGKVLVLTEDSQTGSIASEIAAWIGENCFANLDAPVMYLGSLDTPIPFSNTLEQNYLPKQRLKEKLNILLNW